MVNILKYDGTDVGFVYLNDIKTLPDVKLTHGESIMLPDGIDIENSIDSGVIHYFLQQSTKWSNPPLTLQVVPTDDEQVLKRVEHFTNPIQFVKENYKALPMSLRFFIGSKMAQVTSEIFNSKP